MYKRQIEYWTRDSLSPIPTNTLYATKEDIPAEVRVVPKQLRYHWWKEYYVTPPIGGWPADAYNLRFTVTVGIDFKFGHDDLYQAMLLVITELFENPGSVPENVTWKDLCRPYVVMRPR